MDDHVTPIAETTAGVRPRIAREQRDLIEQDARVPDRRRAAHSGSTILPNSGSSQNRSAELRKIAAAKMAVIRGDAG